MTNYCNSYPYYLLLFRFLCFTSFPPRLIKKIYCDTLHLHNIVTPIINSVTSVNLKMAGMASQNTVEKKKYTLFRSALQQSLHFSFLVFNILADQISFQKFKTRIFVHGFCSYFNSRFIQTFYAEGPQQIRFSCFHEIIMAIDTISWRLRIGVLFTETTISYCTPTLGKFRCAPSMKPQWCLAFFANHMHLISSQAPARNGFGRRKRIFKVPPPLRHFSKNVNKLRKR